MLITLTDHKVDFIVVGGVGAVLQGAPVTTFDLDVVHSTESGNITRLLAALDSLEACYRTQPDRHLKPAVSQLSSPGHQLLMTRFGPLDLLGSVGRGHTYRDLVTQTVEIELAEGVTASVLNLEALIAVKEETADAKDVAVLPILRRTLEQKKLRRP